MRGFLIAAAKLDVKQFHFNATCGLTFQDVKVPAENLLGKVGDAAKIALNILYVGRLKLGFATLGTAKYAIDRRNRQRMRNILQAEAQRPFVSAPPSS